MEEMKPCPFCGSKNIGVKYIIISHEAGKDCPCSSNLRIWAYCSFCGCEGRKTYCSIVGEEEIIAAAIEGWNRRFNLT